MSPSSADGSAFGARARTSEDARRALADSAPCPCGGGAFGGCCGPILAGEAAATAEVLMRSRFTAFALGDRQHLQATWHPSTRPASLELGDATRWTRLTIDGTEAGQSGDRRGVVAFRAQWREASETGELVERSRFVFQRGRWWYLDGEVG